MASLFSKAPPGETKAPILQQESQFVAHLNSQAYEWLGPRYRYFNKIRNAKHGTLHLLGGINLEELMEATRSALGLVTKTLNAGLVGAHNSLLDPVKIAGASVDGWPDKIEMPDRSLPPNVSDVQDALILGWMPLKFLNLAKGVRDKGKGLDLYAEGLVKKLYFKVVGYYCEPGHWNAERLGYPLAGLAPDAPQLDVNNRLAALKSELDQFAGSYQIFKFGGSPRGASDASTKNTLEDVLDVTKEELVRDLYFQHFIVNGLEQFILHYYLTLLGYTEHPRALRMLTTIFEPALAKCVENRLQFQASFLTEKAKIRIRAEFQAFAHEFDARPPVEDIEEKGKTVRRINYSLRLLETGHFARSPRLTEHQSKVWAGWLETYVVNRLPNPVAFPLLFEVINFLVHAAKFELDGKMKVAATLRAFAEEREKQEMRQIELKKKALAEEKRKKTAEARKFKVLEQPDLAKTIEQEALALEEKGISDIAALEEAVVQRRDAMLARAVQFEDTGKESLIRAAARSAGSVYHVLAGLDPESPIRNEFGAWLLMQCREAVDPFAEDLYRQLFEAMPGLNSTQKIMLRKAIETKIELAADELQVSEEEAKTYRDQIVTRKTQMNIETPGLFELHLHHGEVRATLEQLLDAGINHGSLRVLLQIPLNPPNKPPAKLAPALAQKLVQLNSLIHPFPELDLILPNVEETAPPAKRINFHRLAKALGGGA